MRPAGLWHLYRVRLRARVMQELLAVAGIAVGVGLVFAALVASTSLTGAVREASRGIMGESRLLIQARGPEGLDQRLVRVVRRIDGVEQAGAMLVSNANLIGPQGQQSVMLMGGERRGVSLGGVLVRQVVAETRLSDARSLALTAPVAAAVGVSPGGRVRVQVERRTVSAPVAIELRRSEYGTLAGSPIAVASLASAQRISGMRGRVTGIAVKPAPGRDREVERALATLADGRANVARADHEATAFERAAYPLTQSTSIFCVFSALIGFLFAFSAVLLTVPQRRGFVADLRLAGHEPWVAIELVLFDALVLGAAGSLLGLLAGDQISRHMLGSVPSYLTYAFAVGAERIVTWQSVAIASGAGVVAACFAVFVPLRDVLVRRAASAAGGGTGFGPGRWAIAAGLVALGVVAAGVAVAPATGQPGLLVLTAALLLLLPTLLHGSTHAFERLTRTTRTPVPTLAALELRSRSTRTRALALASTGAAAVFAAVTIVGAQADLQRGLDASLGDGDRNGDVWVTFSSAANAFATTPLRVPDGTVATLRRLPGVASVGIYRGSFLDVGDYRAWVQAPPPSAPAPMPPSQVPAGDLAVVTARLRAGGWVVLSKTIADHLGAEVGGRVTLPSPVPTRLHVAAVSTNLGWPPGAIVLNADDYARAWGSSAVSALQIRLAAGSSPVRVAAATRRVLGPSLPASVETLRQRIDRHDAASRQTLHVIGRVSVLVLVAALIAMATAMGAMIWQRRPAFAALKVHGYPEGELWRALLLESALLLGTGCLAGAVFGLFGQLLMSRSVETITDFPVFYSTASVAAVAILALVTVVAVAMIALPGWLAVRVRPTPGGAT